MGNAEYPNGGAPPHGDGGHCPPAAAPMAATDAKSTCSGSGCACKGMMMQFALQETKVAAGYPAITACMGAGP